MIPWSRPRRWVVRMRHHRLKRRLAGPRLLRTFARTHPDARFVEVGSNDGEQHDHLRPFILSLQWSGIMVEPVPYVFDRLQANYAGLERVILENIAVADHDGRLPFYYLVPPEEMPLDDLPDWYDGIGSFSREAVLKHVDHIPDIEQRIICREVPCQTLQALCRRHGFDRLDLLLVDTEGHDWEILRSVDYAALQPELVVYEHYHLSAGDRKRCREHLEDLGYATLEEGFDTFCLRVDRADPRLARTWRQLRPAVPGIAAYEEAR